LDADSTADGSVPRLWPPAAAASPTRWRPRGLTVAPLLRYTAAVSSDPPGYRRIFDEVATAVLARTLPRVREFLEDRFGARAALGELQVDGRDVHVIDADLPLGEHLHLQVDRAVLRLTADALGGAPVRLSEMTGTLRSRVDDGPGALVAKVRFGGSEEASASAWVDGALTVEEGTWGEDGRPLHARTRLTVGTRTFSLTDGALYLDTHRVDFTLRGETRGQLDHLRFETGTIDARALLTFLVALRGGRGLPPLPLLTEGVLEGGVRWSRGVGPEGRFELLAAATALTLKLEPSLGRGAFVLEGEVGLPDLGLTSFPAVDLGASSALIVEAKGRGPWRSLELDGRFRIPTLKLVTEDEARVELSAQASGKPELRVRGQLGAGPSGLLLRGLASTSALDLELKGEIAAELLSALVGAPFDLDGGGIGLEGRIDGPPQAPRLSLTGEASRLDGHRDQRSLAIRDLHAELTPDRALALRASLGETGRLHLRHRDETEVSFSEVSPETTASLVALMAGGSILGVEGEQKGAPRLLVPKDAVFDATMTRTPERLSLHVVGRTPRSRLDLEGAEVLLPSGEFEAGTLHGHLAFDDAAVVGLFPGAVRPEEEGALRGALRVRGRGRGLTLTGRLQTERLTLATEDGRSLPPLEDVSARLVLGGRGLELDPLRARVFRGPMTLRVALPFGEGPRTVAVELERARPAAWLSERGVTVPPDLEVGGNLAAELGGGALSAQLQATTAGSRLRLSPVLEEGVLRGPVVGTVALDELRGEGVPALEGRVEIDGAFRGTRARPSLAVTVRSTALGAVVGGQAIPLEQLAAELRLAPDRIVLRRGRVELFGGALRLRGLWSRGRLPGLRAEAHLTGLDPSRLPLPDVLAGRLDAGVHLRRGADGRWRLRGGARLEEAELRPTLLSRIPEEVTDALARIGLGLPGPYATSPWRIAFAMDPEALEIHALTAALDGLRVDAYGLGTREGIRGNVGVFLEGAWLTQSPWLRGFGEGVDVPLRVRGTPARPLVFPDPLVLFDRGLRAVPGGDRFIELVDALVAWAEGRAAP
jgi:hypothetical protein